jgi:tRNA(His) 5'-end guanylyltransferase
LIRLDGSSFHTFLIGIQKPFDDRITQAMIQTTKDLLFKFKPTTAYTFSDEISLVFPPTETPEPHQYNGRIQKLASLTAGYASARFNHHLRNSNWQEPLKSKMESGQAFFDSRVCIASKTLITENIFWRSNQDCFRNAISQISISKYSHNQVNGKSIKKQLEVLGNDGVDVFEKFDLKYLFGTFVKREKYYIEAVNQKTKKVEECERTRMSVGSFNFEEYTEVDRLEFLFRKYWNGPGLPPIRTE